MKKKCLMMCVAAVGALSVPKIVWADDGDKLLLHLRDGGQTQEVLLADLQKITFGADAFTMLVAGSTTEVKYDAISKLTFGLKGSGVENVMSDSGLLLYPNPAVDCVNLQGWNASEPAVFSVYSVTGQCCLTISDWMGEPVSVSGLEKGLYIIKVNNNVFKFWKL